MSRILFTKKRWEEVNNINKQLMKEYLLYCRSENKGKRTIGEYEHDLKFFLCWNLLHNDNMSVLDFKKKHFNMFKLFMLEERGASNARVNRLLSAIRTMMSYAEDDDDDYEDYIRNPAAKIKGLEKNPIKENAFISQEQIDLLRTHLINHKMYQELCLLDILYDTGARINEVLQVKDTETAHRGFIKVICKGGRSEYILLHGHWKESLKLYLKNRNYNGPAFWISKNGPVTETSTLRCWVHRMYKILVQLDPKTPYFTPHSFRHTFLENTTNGTHYICEEIGRALTMEEAQLLAHHKSIDMTKSYLKPKDNEMIFRLFGIKLD